MKISEMDALYPIVWVVACAPLTMYHDIEKLFLTEEEARDYYNSLRPFYPREYDLRIYHTHDVWGWSDRERARRATQ